MFLDHAYTVRTQSWVLQSRALLLSFSFTFIVLGYKLCYPWIPGAVIEELSSQHRNEKTLKVGDGPEMRETELDVLQRLWNKGVRKQRERSRARHAAQTAS